MMAAMIICIVTNVPDGTTIVCSDHTQIRIAGLEVRARHPMDSPATLAALTLGRKIACLPAGNEGPFIVAKCALPDQRDLACTLIEAQAAVRSDASWRRYGLEDCAG